MTLRRQKAKGKSRRHVKGRVNVLPHLMQVCLCVASRSVFVIA